ncbi:alpha/beta hydrolase [Sphaerisporangium fuscum]|uniref:alpha/beta hydrolase n=1 Tax=Sphaerisporangium fuscum TaxID=2835868 RepID=UPI001BDC628E|nr:alpha/beta hydrolase [Sphaerisporangium fuscum]
MGRTVFAAVSVAGVLGALALLAPGPGDRRVEVFGDLATADRVAVIVPGSDVTLKTFDGGRRKWYSTPGGAARALTAQMGVTGPGVRTAVVAWLGYDSPRTYSLAAATDTVAAEGARALRRQVMDIRARTAVPITLLCHSYGSVVCARALPGLPVSDVAVVGSPGLGVARASALKSPARLWAGRGAEDWMRFVPSVKLGPLGFGADPVRPSFGARVFQAGTGGHSDYFQPGSLSLRNLALITLGRASEVEVAR